MAAVCLQTRQEIVVVSRGRRRRPVPGRRARSSRCPSCPLPLQVVRPDQPLDLVDRRRPAGALPGRPELDRRRRLALAAAHRQLDAERHPGRRCLAGHGGLVTLASAILFRAGEHRAKDRGLIDRTHRILRRHGRPNADLRGIPRQDFEEVFRSIGAFLDQRGMREVLLAEAPDGFIVQGLVTTRPSAAWCESLGSQVKETLTFLDDDIARFMEEAAARRGNPQPGHPRGRSPRDARSGSLGRYIDEQKPKDVFFFEQDGQFVLRLMVGGPGGLAPRDQRVHPRGHRRARRPGPGPAGKPKASARVADPGRHTPLRGRPGAGCRRRRAGRRGRRRRPRVHVERHPGLIVRVATRRAEGHNQP